MFFIFLLAYLGIGAYCLAAYNGQLSTYNAALGTSLTISVPGQTDTTSGAFAGTAVGMIALSILLSIGFVLLAKNFPKCMVYGLIAFSVLLFLAVAAVGFGMGSYIIGGVFAGIAALYSLILFCCLRGHL